MGNRAYRKLMHCYCLFCAGKRSRHGHPRSGHTILTPMSWPTTGAVMLVPEGRSLLSSVSGDSVGHKLSISTGHWKMDLMGSFGSGEVVERWTRDQKVWRPSPGRRISFSRVNILCWPFFQYPLHHHVTTVACKRSQSFCQKCRWQFQVAPAM